MKVPDWLLERVQSELEARADSARPVDRRTAEAIARMRTKPSEGLADLADDGDDTSQRQRWSEYLDRWKK